MLKKFPFVKQEGFKDCGCACLSMIINYYGGNVSIERLRDLTLTNKNGTSAYNLVNACSELGFYAKGVSCKINDMKNVVLPCIAHVVLDGKYKHYVVIYKIDFDKKMFFIADPGSGIKKVSFDAFSNIWTGVLIILYPCKTLPFYKKINFFQYVYNICINYKRDLLLLLLLSFIVILLKISSSFYFKFIIEGINVSKNYLKSVFIIFSLLTFTKLVINFFRSRFLIILNSKLDFWLTLDAFKHIILLPYHYYHNRTSGEVVSKINDLSDVRDIISKVFVNIFIDLPLVIISCVFLIKINVKLFVIACLMLILYIALSFIYNNIYNFYIQKIKSDKENINSYMYECISGFETVKGLSIEDKVIHNFNNKYILFLNNVFKLQCHINNQCFLKDFINDIGNIFIIYLGSLLVIDGNLSFGVLITYSSLIGYFLEPIKNIVDMDIDFKQSREAIIRVLSLYEKYDDNGLVDFKYGCLEFNNLSFDYGGKTILNHVNLKFCRGDKVLIYGASGSGKSTLLKLIMKYYKVLRGSLLINGIDINDYKTKSLRQKICYISQNELLFSDSLINNLRFYSRNDNDVMNISKVTEFNEIIDDNLGFNMMIEENGSNLSGGQRQRIVLARSLLKNADIMLIDEGFSQLDVSLERKILENIFLRFKDKMIIVVSHRMENLDLYNHFVCINNGEVIRDEKVK